jgi:antitoxin component YwqK of YwqJK toxin-antitoxin module
MRSNVAYVDGKKNGEERVLSKTGQLAATITWKKGVRDGKERTYSDDGKKVVKEVVWADGVVKESTELYLNGNPKLREVFDGDQKMHRSEYFDIGKVRSEGDFLRCVGRSYGYRRNDWCEEGLHKSWYENGTHASETSFKAGKREGTSKAWFENGKPAAVEEYAADKLTKAKRWDENGVLKVDEEYEADGSRKLKH